MDPRSWQHLMDQARRSLDGGDGATAEVHLTAALRHAEQHADPDRVASALVALAELRLDQRRREAAMELLKRALALCGEPGSTEARQARALLERAHTGRGG